METTANPETVEEPQLLGVDSLVDVALQFTT